MSRGGGPVRASGWVLGVRVAWGATLVTVPGTVLRLIGGADEATDPKRVMRVLGARHLLQAGAEHRWGAPARRIGVVTDALHGLSDIGFALADRRWRRAALTDALITSVFAASGCIG